MSSNKRNSDRSGNSIEKEPRDKDELEPSEVPRTNTNRIVKQATKDHKSSLHAIVNEWFQNVGDALFWSIDAGHRSSDDPCEIYIRVDSAENTVEVWDTAIGMGKEKLAGNFLSYGYAGDEKLGKNTGGDQGKGYWAMTAWGERAYVETFDRHGQRWNACTWTNKKRNRSQVKQVGELGLPSEFGDIETPRPELTTPGVYIQVQGLSDDQMEWLTNVDQALELIHTKFSMAFASDQVTFNVTYEVDGEEYSPREYDFSEIVSDAAIIKNEDLGTFTLDDQTRQLTDLTLIDSRELPDGFEPPWEGVAMLKAGEYAAKIPYFTVWPYKPNNTPAVSNQELWGWVNASSLCPDQEDHGHTSFKNTSIYDKSGLRERIVEVANKYFQEESVVEESAAAEQACENVNNYVNDFDPTITGSSNSNNNDDTLPDDPKIHVSTGGYYFDVGEEIPFHVMITNPNKSGLEEFHVSVELQRVLDEKGNKIPEEDRQDPRTHADTGSIQSGVRREPTTDNPPKYTPNQEGGYEIRLELKEKPDVAADPTDFSYQMALEQKPLRDTSTHTFYVGDEVETKSTNTSTKNNSAPNHIESLRFIEKEDNKHRVLLIQDEGLHVMINKSHPEYEQMVNVLCETHSEKEVKAEIGTKWAIQKLMFKRTTQQIKEKLSEHGINNGTLERDIENAVDERVKNFEEFTGEFSKESPVQSN